MKYVPVCLLLVALVLGGFAASAAPTSEATGVVTDLEGNPIAGVTIVFTPLGNPDVSYKGTTNKKGKYWVSGMLTPGGNDMWKVTFVSDEYVPAAFVMETRNVNKTLLGDPIEKTLKPGQELPDFLIRPMGAAKVDFTVITQEQAKQRQAEELAELQAAADAAAAEEAQKRADADPWTEALSRTGAGDLEGAIEYFDKAIEQQPDNPERRSGYATVLYQLERMDGAAEQAMRAVELDGSDIESRLVLYGVYMNTGRLDEAGEILAEARSVDPGNVRILQQMAYLAAERGDTAAAIEAHEALVAADPELTESWLTLGDLYAENGNAEKSEQAYSRVIDLDPSNAHQIFFNIGALMMNKADRSETETQSAISAFRKAVEIKPDYAQAYQQLAFAQLAVNDRDGARGSLESYVQLAPDAPDAAQMQQIITTLAQ